MFPIYIIVIPAEGDSAETEQWYVNALRQHYQAQNCRRVEVLVFEHSENPDVVAGTKEGIQRFLEVNAFEDAEIHAQGGFGAYVATELYRACPEQIRRIFFIGGAPCTAMPLIQKMFHRHFARLWYHLPIRYFADDPRHPTPEINAIVTKIRSSSTACMRQHPLRYRNQLVHIGHWTPQEIDFRRIKAHYVPNGRTLRPKFWDNSYRDRYAQEAWAKFGVMSISQPGCYFSFYSLMPAEQLFAVMDEIRTL